MLCCHLVVIVHAKIIIEVVLVYLKQSPWGRIKLQTICVSLFDVASHGNHCHSQATIKAALNANCRFVERSNVTFFLLFRLFASFTILSL
jgi:hypothetical protein